MMLRKLLVCIGIAVVTTALVAALRPGVTVEGAAAAAGGGTSAGGGGDTILVGYYGDLDRRHRDLRHVQPKGIDSPSRDQPGPAARQDARDPHRGRPGQIRGGRHRRHQARSPRTRSSPSSARSPALNSLAAAPVCQREQVPMITPVLDQPAGHRGRRLHLPRLLHRPVPGLRDGEVRPREPEGSSKVGRSCRTARATTRIGPRRGLRARSSPSWAARSSPTSLQRRATPTSTRSSPRSRSTKPGRDLRPGLLHRGRARSRARRASWASRCRCSAATAGTRAKLFEMRRRARSRAATSRNHYSPEDPTPRDPEVHRRLTRQVYGEVPDALAALGYDAAKILADAMKRAGLDRRPRRCATRSPQTKDFPGVTGTITIDEKRNAVKPAVVLKIEDGKTASTSTTVNPESRRGSS